jgi:hypothetical protein
VTKLKLFTLKKTYYSTLLILLISISIISCKKENRTKTTDVEIVVKNSYTSAFMPEIYVEVIQVGDNEAKTVFSEWTNSKEKITLSLETVKHKSYTYKVEIDGNNKQSTGQYSFSLYNYIDISGDENSYEYGFNRSIEKGVQNSFLFDLLEKNITYVEIYNENCMPDDEIKVEYKNLLWADRFGNQFHDLFENLNPGLYPELKGCVDTDLGKLIKMKSGTNIIKKTITQNGSTTVIMDTIVIANTQEQDSLIIVY